MVFFLHKKELYLNSMWGEKTASSLNNAVNTPQTLRYVTHFTYHSN